MAKKKEKPQSWIVRMRCVVIKDVIVNCTGEQAVLDPWNHAESEEEVEQQDFDVINVRLNA